jgi:hypothetical protein
MENMHHPTHSRGSLALLNGVDKGKCHGTRAHVVRRQSCSYLHEPKRERKKEEKKNTKTEAERNIDQTKNQGNGIKEVQQISFGSEHARRYAPADC